MGWGDEIMVSGIARRMRETDPRPVMVLDHASRPRSHPIWLGNPNIASPGVKPGLCQQIVNGPGARPYHLSKDRTRFKFDLSFRADVGQIFLSEYERNFAQQHRPQVVIQPKIKPRGICNKQWSDKSWAKFALLSRTAGLDLVELGSTGLASYVRVIETPDFRHACAVLANAKAYVGHEGGLHHAAAALGIPGVVIFGGYTPIELTGYSIHRNLGASLDEACGMRVPCDHCVDWMNRITPEQVLKELLDVLQ